MRRETVQCRFCVSCVPLPKEVQCGVTRSRVRHKLGTRNRRVRKRISRQCPLRHLARKQPRWPEQHNCKRFHGQSPKHATNENISKKKLLCLSILLPLVRRVSRPQVQLVETVSKPGSEPETGPQ